MVLMLLYLFPSFIAKTKEKRIEKVQCRIEISKHDPNLVNRSYKELACVAGGISGRVL